MDAILFWNSVALEANRRDHTGAMNAVHQRGPTRSSRALAMVHLACHDAYFGIVQPGGPDNPSGIPVYLNGLAIPAPAPNEANAAISFAAYVVLVALYPNFKDYFDSSLAMAGFDLVNASPGRTFGETVGAAILADRATDEADMMVHVPPLGARTDYRTDPTEPPQGIMGEGWGFLKHFSVSGCLPLNPPPTQGNPQYKKDFNEVFVKGSFFPPKRRGTPNRDDRTALETLIGIFWAYDGANEIGTPPRLYNQMIRTISTSRGLSAATTRLNLWQNARLFALANVAMADAGILAWYYKLLYYLWRPVIGIRERDLSMGPKADLADAKNVIVPKCDPFWVPLGSPRTNANSAPTKSFTPPFPSYPSGHATFGAACFEIVRNFYGFDANTPDTISLEFVSDELNGNSRDSYFGQRTRHVRRFDSLIELLYENAVSRIFLGVHWRFDGTSVHRPSDVIGDTRNVGGVPLGRAIAIDIFNAGMPKTGGTCAPIVRAIA